MQRALNSKLTYDDYAAIPSNGRIYEIVDGEVYVTPAPSPFHQRASKRLQRQLEAFFEAPGHAEVFNAPIDLILTNHDVTQPDLVVVEAAAITRRGIEAPPLLVVEVLSPPTESFDSTGESASICRARRAELLDPGSRPETSRVLSQ
jgi:Uma2 family endonuclease